MDKANYCDLTKVSYVSSHGMAGDHLFDWFAKALGGHLEIYVYMGESIRSKYMKERSRKERPDLEGFTNFLGDMCSETYDLSVECFSYRAYQLEYLSKVYNENIRWINLVRHPYAWLDYYVNWRVNNLNMPEKNAIAIDHEWEVACHEEFNKLGLKKYNKSDRKIWASYQGMHIMNRMVSDQNIGVKNITIESIVSSKTIFMSTVDYLSKGRVNYSNNLLDIVFKSVDTPFRKDSYLIEDPYSLRKNWPEWKRDAFSLIVKKDTISMFKNYDYKL